MTAADTSSAAGATTRAYKFADKHGRSRSITIDDSRDARLTEFGKATVTDRYLLPGERFQDMFARVAVSNSDEVVRGEDTGHAQRIYDAISLLWFMPATPVLTNSGVDRGLPISCFLNRVGDNMESIAETVNENIWLAAKGGGIGTCWNDVRSINEPVGLVGKTSGIVPFIQWQDAQTQAISQGNLRRGSAAVYLDISHPEIEDFIDIRRHQGGDPRRKAHNIHHGVTIPNAFLEKAYAGKDSTPEQRAWNLISPKTGEVLGTVDARDLMVKLVTTRLETGEPYIIFSDRVADGQPEIQKELELKVVQSNLCSEITLPTGKDHLGNWRTAVCCLSSLVWDTMQEWFMDEQFLLDVMRFVDNVLDVFIAEASKYPGFDRAIYSAQRERSVGIGMMGFHSMLQAAGIPFESEQAAGINKRAWKWLKETADKHNDQLAEERGECPDSADARARNPSLKRKRLSNVFSIAPTASISIIAGGASACGEPIPANSYTQKTLSGSFNVRNPHLDKVLRRRFDEVSKLAMGNLHEDFSLLLRQLHGFESILMAEDLETWLEDTWQSITINDGSIQHLAFLNRLEKATFKTAFEIDQRWVVRHHADRAPYICQAQSMNIFLPSTVHKIDLWNIHKLMWELGVKSAYYLRSRAASKAMAVSHVAGEMPSPQLDTAGPMYVDEPDCAACQ